MKKRKKKRKRKEKEKKKREKKRNTIKMGRKNDIESLPEIEGETISVSRF